jgi:hypothetical protein
MEPEIRLFFAKIVKSISMIILWMMLNITFGLYFHLGFIYSHISIINILYYLFLLGSSFGLVWYLLRVWKESVQQ